MSAVDSNHHGAPTSARRQPLPDGNDLLAAAVAGAGAVAVAVAGAGAVAAGYFFHSGTSWMDFLAFGVTARISIA